MAILQFVTKIALCTAILSGICLNQATLAGEGEKSSPHSAEASHGEEHVAAGSEKLAAHYSSEVDRLRDLSAGSVDPCVNAIYVAVKDKKVRRLFLNKVSNPHYVFKTVRCLDQPSIPEYRFVLFDFDCSQDVFCLIDPNFLVIVDVVNAQVVDIIDPYLGGLPKAKIARLKQNKGDSTEANVVELAIIGTSYQFAIDGEVNPTITVKEGDTVRVTLTSGDHSHDWKLVYEEGGSERPWAKTPTVGNGQSATVEFQADRVGEFKYFCSIGTHRQRGMEGKFVVEP